MYLWILAAWWIIVIPVTWFLLKRVIWDPFIKFHGLHYAKKNDSSSVLIVDEMGDTEMVAEHIAKCIFSYGEDDYEIEIPELPLTLIRMAGIVAAVLGIVLAASTHWLFGFVLVPLGIAAFFIERVAPWVYAKLFWYPTKYLKDIDWQKAILYKIGNVNFDCKIARELQGGDWDQYPVVNCGGVLVEIVFDSDHWCERRSRQHKAIVKSAREWNKDNPHDQVHTYTKFQRYLEAGLIEVPAGLKKEYLVPWERIDLGFPLNLKSVDSAGKLRQMAKTKEAKPAAEISKWTMWLILGGVGIFIIELVFRFLSKLILH